MVDLRNLARFAIAGVMVLVGMAAAGVAPVGATSTTLYVGPGGGSGNCPAPTYTTIQSAVIASTPHRPVAAHPGGGTRTPT